MQKVNLKSKENNTKNETILFWKSLFPEIESIDEISDFLLALYDKDINDFLIERDIEREFQREYIKKVMKYDDINSDFKTFKQIKSRFYNNFQWIAVFKPLLLKFDKLIKPIVLQSDIVKNKGYLMDSLYNQILQGMINRSFRVIILEMNLARENKLLLGKNKEERHNYFFDKLVTSREFQIKLYNKYPELIRILDLLLENTINYVDEILNHTSIYKTELFNQMNKQEIYLLEDIEFSFGDSHNDNKTVAKLLFENEYILMYKPRSLEAEQSYRSLINWFEEKMPGFKKPYTANIFTKGKFGYMEFIKREECETQENVNSFYYKMGEILAILYSLNSKDFHGENIIAFGGDPVLIDLETLLHKTETIEGETINSYHNIMNIINDSVVSMAILPTSIINRKENLVMEIGALNSGKMRRSPYQTQIVEDLNTDSAHVKNIYKELGVIESSPKYKGNFLSADDYLPEVKNGFITTYNWIKENKEKYYEKLKDIFNEGYSRYIYRSTNNYTQLLETSYHPDLLQNRLDRYIYFHRIISTIDINNQKEIDMCKAEIKELLDGDVPLYIIKNDSNNIMDMNNKNLMIINGPTILESIKSRLSMFSNIDLKRQVSLINQCFIGSGLNTDIPRNTNIYYKESKTPIDKSINKELAINITNLMMDRAIHNKHKKTISWIGMKGFGERYYENRPLESDLYQGNAGIAIALISMYHSTNMNIYKLAANESINYIIEYLDLVNIKDISMGAFSGLYGSLYSICLAMEANVLPYDDATVNFIIEKIKESEELLCNLQNADIISGLSGILGSLLTIKDIIIKKYPRYKNIFTNTINITFNSIEKRAIYLDNETVTWNEDNDGGYAHGNAGIVTQIMRCYKQDNDIRKFELIKKNLNYERNYLKDSASKWKVRKNSQYSSWCNGINGILLSRLFLFNNGYIDSKITSEIDLLIKQLKSSGFRHDISLCHGDLGTLIILDYAGRFLKNNMNITSNTLINESAQDYYKFKKKLFFETEDWGLMTGTSGVIVSLLHGIGTIDVTKLLLLDNPFLGDINNE